MFHIQRSSSHSQNFISQFKQLIILSFVLQTINIPLGFVDLYLVFFLLSCYKTAFALLRELKNEWEGVATLGQFKSILLRFLNDRDDHTSKDINGETMHQIEESKRMMAEYAMLNNHECPKINDRDTALFKLKEEMDGKKKGGLDAFCLSRKVFVVMRNVDIPAEMRWKIVMDGLDEKEKKKEKEVLDKKEKEKAVMLGSDERKLGREKNELWKEMGIVDSLRFIEQRKNACETQHI